jgi:ABC-type sugar transport system ATPase subunit
MNFVAGHLVGEDGEPAFEGSWGRLALGPRMDFREGARTGDSLVMGIRPESITCGDESADGEGATGIRATVSDVETLGDRTHVYLRGTDGSEWVARTVGRVRPVAGQAVTMLVDAERVHFFRPTENGRRIAQHSA